MGKREKNTSEFSPASVDIIKTKYVCPLQTLYGFKYLIKQEQTGLTAIPREPLQVYSFFEVHIKSNYKSKGR